MRLGLVLGGVAQGATQTWMDMAREQRLKQEADDLHSIQVREQRAASRTAASMPAAGQPIGALGPSRPIRTTLGDYVSNGFKRNVEPAAAPPPASPAPPPPSPTGLPLTLAASDPVKAAGGYAADPGTPYAPPAPAPAPTQVASALPLNVPTPAPKPTPTPTPTAAATDDSDSSSDGEDM